jgi:translocator protein
MNYLKVAGCVLACECAGLIGGIFTFPSIAGWYAFLAKPPLVPPNWVFGPVWTLLYALMGVSLYLLLEKKAELRFFMAQLALNILWSFAFFGQRSPLYGMLVIIPLIAAIALTMKEADKTVRNAALLLAPYLLWTIFASYLNLGVFLLNP